MDRDHVGLRTAVSLWGAWWNAMELLRPAFSRHGTFLWFATIVAGMTVRPDMLGVTSIVRALNLRGALYLRLLAHFHQARRPRRIHHGAFLVGGQRARRRSAQLLCRASRSTHP
jgi:hypothetical protein